MKLKDLPIGARLMDPKSKLVFVVAGEHGHTCDGIPLLSERVTTVSSFDAAEPEHIGVRLWDGFQEYGWNNYEMSNIHQ